MRLMRKPRDTDSDEEAAEAWDECYYVTLSTIQEVCDMAGLQYEERYPGKGGSIRKRS
jgi:hypothetical protein